MVLNHFEEGTRESSVLDITQKDYDIQKNRIIYVLNRVYEKLEVLCYLPCLLNEKRRILRPYLTCEEYQYISSVCHEYLHGKKEETLIEFLPAKDPLKDRPLSISLNPMVEPKVAKLFDIIFAHRELCGDLVFIFNKAQMNAPFSKFAEEFVKLKKITEEKLQLSGDQIEKYLEEITRLYKTDKHMDKEIEEVKDMFDNLTCDVNDVVTTYRELKKLRKMIKQHKEMNANRIFEIIANSEYKMMQETLLSEETQERLLKIRNQTRTNYELLLETNLNEERSFKAARSKIEANLAAWVVKYDNDILERQNELDELTEQFNTLTDKFDDLQRRFDAQEVQYELLLKEKIKTEDEVFEKLIRWFTMNRSARIIQRWWRSIKLLKMKKRKTVKGKKATKKGAVKKGKIVSLYVN